MSMINGIPFVRRLFGCKDRVVPDGRTLGEVVAGIVGVNCGDHAVVWDGFCGSAYCGMIFKRHGFQVVSSDIRPSAWLRSSALVQANSPAISAAVAEELAKATPKAKGWFTATKLPLIGSDNAAWLDAIAEALPKLDENAQLACVLGINWAVETLLHRGSRFLHIKYSLYDDILCGGWHMRDKTLAAEWLRFMVEDYPGLIFDNGQHNASHMGDAVALASSIAADAAYFDPPYAAQFSSYKGSYDIVDDWPAILLGRCLPAEPEGSPHLRFSSPDNAIASFSTLMERAKHIPLWIISYSDSDTMRVTPEEIAVLAESEGRTTEILRFPFPRSRVIKGQGRATCNECLIVCRADQSGKKKAYVPSSHAFEEGTCIETSICETEKQSVDRNPTCVSLFSGVGGTDLALEMAGFRCVLACEKNETAREVYEANFGRKPHPDVRKMYPAEIPPCDLLSAGWPCQALSVGGLHKGMDDERCQLVLEIIRLAAGSRPKVILLENAFTLPTHDAGRLLKDIQSRFEAIGYHGTWRILDASNFGLPTLRKRTYVVLFRDDLGVSGFEFPKPSGDGAILMDILLPDQATGHMVLNRPDIILDPEAVVRAERCRKHYTMCVGRVGQELPARQGTRIYSPSGCCATICSGGGGWGAKTGLYLINGTVRPLHPREAARALGFPDSFLLPINENESLRLIGNSVAVPVMAMVARRIAERLGFGEQLAPTNAHRATTQKFPTRKMYPQNMP